MNESADQANDTPVRRMITACGLILAAIGSTVMLAMEAPVMASELSLRYAWYGVGTLAAIWGVLELVGLQWRGKPARAASLFGILTLAQAVAVAALQLVVAWFSADGPSVLLGLATLIGLPLLVTVAVALGPPLLRRLTALP